MNLVRPSLSAKCLSFYIYEQLYENIMMYLPVYVNWTYCINKSIKIDCYCFHLRKGFLFHRNSNSIISGNSSGWLYKALTAQKSCLPKRRNLTVFQLNRKIQVQDYARSTTVQNSANFVVYSERKNLINFLWEISNSFLIEIRFLSVNFVI